MGDKNGIQGLDSLQQHHFGPYAILLLSPFCDPLLGCRQSRAGGECFGRDFGTGARLLGRKIRTGTYRHRVRKEDGGLDGGVVDYSVHRTDFASSSVGERKTGTVISYGHVETSRTPIFRVRRHEEECPGTRGGPERMCLPADRLVRVDVGATAAAQKTRDASEGSCKTKGVESRETNRCL